MSFSRKIVPLLITLTIFILYTGCKSTEEFSGYSYDPEGVTETTDKEIEEQNRRTIGFREDGVWISNEFSGSRVNDVVRVAPYHYELQIRPEISPINNSPWYGFQVWADDSSSVTLELTYTGGRHRYRPDISFDGGESWNKADSTIYRQNRENSSGIISLEVGESPVWISAQVPQTTKEFRQWSDKIALRPFVQRSVAGSSHRGRPIYQLKISEHSDEPVKGVILIYGRQHPPEIPGYLTGLFFIEELVSDSELAQQFRKYFDVWAFPLMNPDGADNGHWRTNAAGIDLNRDWQYFNQPETAAVQRAALPLLNRSDRKVFYAIDFHSTGQTVFYPILEEIDTFPHLFTYRWLDAIRDQLPDLEVNVEPFPTDSPIAKNWSHKTFGVDAVTFEVWDNLPNEELQQLGAESAQLFMTMMIEEFKKEFK
ncbi:M14 family metallopeptidase [Rhodohalobacter halophilus]|uniref:M14 family metallopeptidase n=1 Tax=Rhodohalobacter halophilus TaxID=1812810 RepID=UPI00083FAB01|nr:M14 family metallopeptidase [Rhodohalobacter halophilus]